MALACCATSYHGQRIGGGFSEKKLSDSQFIVTFNGNGFATRDRVYYFWLYRCAELTLRQGYGLYVLGPNQRQSENFNSDPSLRPAVYRHSDGGGLVKTGGTFIFIPVPMNTPGRTMWTYSGTVSMFKKPLSRQLPFAIDAQQVVDSLKPYVDSDGNRPPPGRGHLFARSFVAHTRVTFGEEATEVVAVAASHPAATPPQAPRTREQILDVLEEIELSPLHAAYADYLLHLRSRKPFGMAVFSFSIAENGLVTDCHETSSSIDDESFNTSVANLVRNTRFAAGLPVTVNNLQIAFDLP